MKFFRLILCMLVFVSCNDDADRRAAENIRDQKKKEAIFKTISNEWNFNSKPINPTAQQLTSEWAQWRSLLNELSQKPQRTIGAFRKKAKVLSLRVKDLNTNIPKQFNKPEIKSRVAVLTTKINSLNLFINLPEIPERKVILLINDINSELTSLQSQMGEIVRKTQIPKEVGEEDMIRMLDTSRAIPNNPKVTPF